MPSQEDSERPTAAVDPVSRSVSAADARLRAILDSALDALITIDSDSRIVEFNRAAETTFGYTRPEIIGLEMGDVIVPPALREGHRTGMAHYLRTGEGPILDRRIEITAMRRDGSLFPVELTVTRVSLEAGEEPLFTGALREDELARKGSRLNLRIDTPVVGVWDRRRMEQVVGNLLSNAIKYGEGRPIEVDVRFEGPDAVLSVRDHGIGIAPHDTRRIFERFERAVSDRHFGGLGLGLWIANEIVQASGGTLGERSGRRFHVHAPHPADPARRG